MQSSWNQWSSGTANYASSYPGTFSSVSAAPAVSNSFSTPASVPAPSIGSQFPNLYGQQQTSTTQQQWHQWEQWQQQYAQWQQQYGDKFQASLQSTGMIPSVPPTMPANFPAMPPLPPSAPSAQPPPPDSIPPSDRDGSNKRPHDGNYTSEETKKQKVGKGKSETLESLIESEKTFDQQFKTWESSFLQWKEENANHPDKAQYKEYEAKWESFREQLLQKRESLRRKRENKETEVAAAAKEAAAKTSTLPSILQSGYCTSTVTQSNPFSVAPQNMMYSMPGMYPSQDLSQMMTNQTTNNFMSSYPIFNLPPPPTMPALPDNTLDQKMPDLSKPSQTLEFLSSNSLNNAKSIPGLGDIVGSDKSANPPFMSNNYLFAYNHDKTKPLRTSDDQPFKFPRPQQNYEDRDAQNQYSYNRRRPQFEDNLSFNRMNKGNFSHFDRGNQNANSNARFSNANNRPNDFNKDFNKYRGGNFNDDRSAQNSNNSAKFTPNFNSEKYAKYLEDEYDDSRFRDPEPDLDYRDNYRNKQNYSGDSSNLHDYNRRDLGDSRNLRGGYIPWKDNRSQFGNDRKDTGFGGNSFNRDGNRFGNRNQFGRGVSNDNSGNNGLGRNTNMNDLNIESEKKLQELSKPISLLDLPLMKPPEAFDRKKPLPDLSAPPPLFSSDNLSSQMNETQMFSHPNELQKPFSHPNEPPPKLFPHSNESPKPLSHQNEPQKMFFQQNEPPKPYSHPNETRQLFPHPNEANKPFSQHDTKFPENTNDYVERDFNPNVNPIHNKSATIGLPKTIAHAVVTDPMLQEPLVPSQIFEYDHISRCGSTETAIQSFEPIYVFDYGHGKKKATDFMDLRPQTADFKDMGPRTTDFVDMKPKMTDFMDSKPRPSLVSKLGSNDDFLPTHEEDRWEENNMNESVSLPPRIKNFTEKHVKNIETELNNLRNDVINNVNSHQDKNGSGAAVSPSEKMEASPLKKDEKSTIVKIEDLLCPPGRISRPSKLVIIMRGPPGSGKSYTAKLIKDKEVEMQGNARILSLDDYFTVEYLDDDDSVVGKKKTTEGLKYEYDAALEPSYIDSLIKSFKKNITDGFFPFIIVDCINEKVKHFEEMCNFGRLKGFQVYICEMEKDLDICKGRNIHNRTEEDIIRIIKEWEPTPCTQTLVDVNSLVKKDAPIEVVEVEETPAESNTNGEPDTKVVAESVEEEIGNTEVEEGDKTTDVEEEKEGEPEEYTSYMEVLCASKWEKMEQTEEKLDRLDGVSRKRASTSFNDWLQLPNEGDLSWYSSVGDSKGSGDVSISKKKRVRWADLEERLAQQKMRKFGFVVGQTDWKRMMDPSFGGNKLTQTKYI